MVTKHGALQWYYYIRGRGGDWDRPSLFFATAIQRYNASLNCRSAHLGRRRAAEYKKKSTRCWATREGANKEWSWFAILIICSVSFTSCAVAQESRFCGEAKQVTALQTPCFYYHHLFPFLLCHHQPYILKPYLEATDIKHIAPTLYRCTCVLILFQTFICVSQIHSTDSIQCG